MACADAVEQRFGKRRSLPVRRVSTGGIRTPAGVRVQPTITSASTCTAGATTGTSSPFQVTDLRRWPAARWQHGSHQRWMRRRKASPPSRRQENTASSSSDNSRFDKGSPDDSSPAPAIPGAPRRQPPQPDSARLESYFSIVDNRLWESGSAAGQGRGVWSCFMARSKSPTTARSSAAIAASMPSRIAASSSPPGRPSTQGVTRSLCPG